MYINELNIKSFGGIIDKKITFNNGMNVLYGENESGKSTVLAFIKFIFYGIANRKSDFKKYIPLSGEPMCGSITVTDGDTEYEISRNSKLTKAKQVQVFNKTTGDIMSVEFAQNIGQNLFGMGEGTFLNTLFLYDAHSGVSGGDGEITTKLSNMAQSGDESVSQKEILKRIDEDIANYISPRRKNAYIPNLEEKISQLSQKMFKAKEDSDKLSSLENKKEEIKKLIKTKKEEKRSLLNKKTQAIRNERKIKLAEYEKRLDDEIKSSKECRQEILNLNGEKYENIKNITEQEEKVFLTSEDFSKYDTKFIILEEREKNLLSKKKMSLAILIFTFFASIGLFVINPVFLLFSVALFVLGIYLMLDANKKIKNTKDEKSQITNQKEENNTAVSNFLSKVKLSSKEEYISLKNEYTQYLSNLSVLNSKMDMLEKDIDFCKKELEKIKEEIIDEFKLSNKDESFTDEEIIKIVKNTNCDFSISEIESKLSSILSEISNLEITFANLEFELDMKKTSSFDIVKILEELENSKILLSEKKEELEIFNEAKSILLEAQDEQRSNFAPALAKKVGGIFSNLTNGKYDEILIDEKFDARIKKDLGYAEQEILSEGTLDQLYFSVRFGIIELVGEKSLPVFLDDAFIRYDEKRLNEVLSFLYEYSKNGQVIVSTCQIREKEFCKDRANIINI